jgi:hypothetical protein
MNFTMEYLFGPLEKSNYCNFFLAIAIFMFVCFVLSIIVFLYGLRKDTGLVFFINSIIVMLLYFLLYFQSRLMYSVCLGSMGR